MSIQGTFNTAVQGMNTQAQSLNIISTNITNVTTTGYKTENTHFETILNHILPNNQSFLTVRDVDSREVDKQGAIATTGRTFDLALNGRGLMVTNTAVDGTGVWKYTRDGALFGKATDLSTKTNGVPDQGTLLTTASGDYVFGWASNVDGTFTQTNDLKSLKPITFASDAVFPFKPTSTINLQANVSAGGNTRQAVTLGYTDTTGKSQTLTLGLTRTQGANWALDATSSSGASVTLSQPSVMFSTDGKIASPTGGLLAATINVAGAPQAMTVDISKVTSFADTGNITVQSTDQDGYLSGTLQNTYFTSDGVLVGSFSNQEVKSLFKLPVATFGSDNNLQAIPGNSYVQTDTSGTLKLQGLGTSPTGTQFVAGALEQSTVDLSDQFSKMIITQRAYASSAQVLKVADQMTQAVRDLKR